jgi:hypothetical protein
MTFTINPAFIAEFFERYQLCLDALPNEWGAEYWEGVPPSNIQNHLSPKAHSLDHLKSLIEGSFWASLEKEEGRCHSLQFVYCNYDLAHRPFVFDSAIPFDPAQVAKLSPAIPKSAAIGVWPGPNNTLGVWGFEPDPSTDSGPCLRVEVLQPGTIIAGCGGPRYFIALLSPDQAGFVDDSLFEPIKRRLDDSTEDLGNDQLGTNKYFQLMRMARAMRSHGHGGTLLVVPADNEDWGASIKWKYRPNSAFKKICEAAVDAIEIPNGHLDLIGQLTAVDGATVITSDLTILGFGAKIDLLNDPDDAVRVSLPLEDSTTEEKTITKLGSTRHQSAARFVRDNKDSIAVVASQDGVVSFIVWDEEASLISVTRHAEWQLR